jgi:hypothetical protein
MTGDCTGQSGADLFREDGQRAKPNFLFGGGEDGCEGKERGPEEVTLEDRQEKHFENIKGGQGRCGEETWKAKREARHIHLPEEGL